MKLTDLQAAAKSRTPNLELEVDTAEGETIEIVFRNLLLVSDEVRMEMSKESAKIANSKAKMTGVRREAEIAKALLAAVVVDKAHIELLEDIFSADPDTRDLNWITLGDSYGKDTQLGEVESSQTR